MRSAGAVNAELAEHRPRPRAHGRTLKMLAGPLAFLVAHAGNLILMALFGSRRRQCVLLDLRAHGMGAAIVPDIPGRGGADARGSRGMSAAVREARGQTGQG